MISRKQRKYISSFEVLENNDYYIELLENYPCNSKKELEIREGIWQEQIECINSRIAGKIKRFENKGEYNKKHYREKGSVKMNCECGSVISQKRVKKTQKNYKTPTAHYK